MSMISSDFDDILMQRNTKTNRKKKNDGGADLLTKALQHWQQVTSEKIGGSDFFSGPQGVGL